MRAAWFLLALAVPASAHAGKPRVAVVVTGSDAAAAGNMQLRFEKALAQPSLQIVPARELGARLAANTPKSATDDALPSLLLRAREAYFDDRLAEAGSHVDAAARFVGAGLGKPGADNTTILSWRTALALALDDRAHAEEAARSCLRVAPDFAPDLDLFRPSVGKLFDSVRKELPAAIDVTLETTSSSGTLQIDEHFVSAGRVKVLPGAHKLFVRAPGFEPTSLAFEATPGLVLRPALPLALDAASARSVSAGVWASSEKDARLPLAEMFGVDVVALVDVRDDGLTRAAILDDTGSIRRRSASVPKEESADLSRWLAGELLARSTGTGLSLSSRIFTVITQRRTDVLFASGDGFKGSVVGSGVGIGGTADVSNARLRGIAEIASYESSHWTFETPEQRYSLHGGRSVGAQIHFSYGVPAAGVVLRPGAGVRYDQDSSGGPRRFAAYPAYSRIDAVVGAAVEADVAPVALEAGIDAAQNLSWTSSNGWTDAAVPIGLEWHAAARWDRRGAGLAFDYRGGIREAEFEGPYPITSAPAQADPSVRDLTHAISVSFQYRFE